jgi:hypothetical protein
VGIVNLEIKLGDLGIPTDEAAAVLLQDDNARIFLAPELKGERPHFSSKADVYSYGVLLCHLFSEGKPLSRIFYCTKGISLQCTDLQEILTTSTLIKANGWEELIGCCLSEAPGDRPDFAMLLSWMPK